MRSSLIITFIFFSLCNVSSANAQQPINTGEFKENQDVTPVLASSTQTAYQWLMRLSDIVSRENYQLSFVQTKTGQETVPYLWRHGIDENGTEYEQLNEQNGPGRELIRINDVVSVFEPDIQPYGLHSQHINGPIPTALLYHPQRLSVAYEFVAVGRARVAGRPAQQIRIVSRDNSRFSYQLWLDEATGMLLKFNMMDLQGAILEQVQVTAFSISPAPSEYFSRINQDFLPKPMALNNAQTKEHSWEMGYLPVGLKEIKNDTRRLALTGQIVEHKMFSDGLIDVSVYVQPVEDAVGTDLALRHELSTFLTLTVGKAQVTVLGEIPLRTAKAMAASLRPAANTSD